MDILLPTLFCLLVLLHFEGPWVEGSVADEDLTITLSEKKALDKLKSRMYGRLPQEYMKRDVYLITWIRAANKKVDKAEEMLKENLKWRKANNMDFILDEEFPQMEEEFPISLDGRDKEGKPVLVVHVGDWDVRRSHLEGLHDQNYRYSLQSLEKAAQLVRDDQAKGIPVTRFQVIFDMEGFNLVQHGCLQCIPPYIKFVVAFQKYYPEMIDKVILVNAPQTLQRVLNAIRPQAGQRLRKMLKIFGTNKKEWQEYIFKFIPRNQLDPALGGTKEF